MSLDLPIVHRAVFGDMRGAHNLIVASPGAPESVLSDLASRYTDRLLPTEIHWDPYSCGFPLQGYYALIRTFPVKATRSGMVQTHALVIPLDQCSTFPFLNELLCLLPSEPDLSLTSSASIDAITLNARGDSEPFLMPDGYPSVVRALLEGHVPVWVGQQGFEQIVSFLWRNLWPDARRELRFRVAAEPSDLYDFPAVLVCTPVGLRMNWSTQYFVDQTATRPQNPSLAESYLLAIPEGRKLDEVCERLQFLPTSIAGLKRLEKYVRMLEADTTDSLRAAMRLLGAMAPNPEQSKAEKESVLARFAQSTIVGTENDVLGLRNLDISAFATAPRVLRGVLAEWLRARVGQRSGGLLVARETFLTRNPWEQIARAAIMDAFASWDSNAAALLWQWWISEPKLVEPSTVLLPEVSGDIENDLISTLPPLEGREFRHLLLTLSRNRGWYRLHGAVLASSSDLTTIEKLQFQIEAEPDLQSRAGLELLVGRIDTVEMFGAALELGDARLLDLAGQVASREPTLMANIDASTPLWRSIWFSYIKAGRELFDGIAQPSVASHAVMDAVLAGSPVSPELLQQLATHAQTDLSMYKRRRDIWQALPPAIVEQAQAVTAGAWLKNFLRDPTFDPQQLELGLQDAVVKHWRAAPSLAPAAAILRLWDRFSSLLTEQDFLVWLDRMHSRVAIVDAGAIGRLVLQNRWNNAGARLAKLVCEGRDDLAMAVQECTNVLGFWDRAWVTLLTSTPVISADEWWDAWLETSNQLYPWGIQDNDIWDKADGDVSRVRQGTGREQWGHALDLLRKGGAGRNMTVEGLLHEMRKDFSGNRALLLLEDIHLKRIRGK